MTDTNYLAAVKADKQAHIQELITALEAAQQCIDSKPDLWWGGKPPALEEIGRFLEHRCENLRNVFELPAAPQQEAE